MPSTAETLGSRIAALRGRTGHSQESFAEILGVRRMTVSGWERDKFQPAIERIPALCQALSVSPDELFGWRDPPGDLADGRERAAAVRLVREAPIGHVRLARAILALAK